MVTTAPPDAVKEISPAGGLRFTVASRPQRRLISSQVVSNTVATPFTPIQIPASGFVRRISLFFTQTATFASGGAVAAGDGPFNLLANATLTDATGQPILQSITGYNLYLVNKYFSSGGIDTNLPRAYGNPQLGPEFAYTASGTLATAVFRLDIDLEQDSNTGYGSIPNLDSNASLQLRLDAAAYTAAFAAGTTPSAVSLTVRVEQDFWAPVGKTLNGIPVQTAPVGVGDYVETRVETQPASASTENLVTLVNRGGLIRGALVVSRAAGVRTAFTAGAPVGVVLDNNPVDEGIPLESHNDRVRRTYGYYGAELALSYAPLTPGVQAGIDRGVIVHNWGALSGGRDSWLSTRPGSQLQLRVTPGAAATQLEIVTFLAQVKDLRTFYSPSALD